MSGVTRESRPIALISGRLGTSDNGSPELCGDGTQPQCGGNTCSVHDAPRGNHRHFDLSSQHPCECKCAETIITRRGITHTPMPASLIALRNDGIHSSSHHRVGCVEARYRGNELTPRFTERLHPI